MSEPFDPPHARSVNRDPLHAIEVIEAIGIWRCGSTKAYPETVVIACERCGHMSVRDRDEAAKHVCPGCGLFASTLTPILCGKCSKAPAEPDHECPYRGEIDGDYDTLCDCCDACRGQCSDDV